MADEKPSELEDLQLEESLVPQAEMEEARRKEDLESLLPEAPGSAEVSEPPAEPVKDRAKALKPYQLDTLAMMMVEGSPTSEIAEALGTSEKHVNRTIRNSKTLPAIVDSYREQSMTLAVRHRYRMISFLDDAYAAVEAALQGDDQNLRYKAAQDVLNRILPPEKQREEPSSVNIAITNPQVQVEMKEAMGNISEGIKSMVEFLSDEKKPNHVLFGDEALPTPETQLQIEDGTGPVGPEDDWKAEAVPAEAAPVSGTAKDD